MIPEEILEKLEDLARGYDIKVVYARLSEAEVSSKGGSCTFQGQPLIIIETNLSPLEKIEILSRELRKWDWSGVFLPPRIRELLGEEKS